jgi:hypothetical protein
VRSAPEENATNRPLLVASQWAKLPEEAASKSRLVAPVQ